MVSRTTPTVRPDIALIRDALRFFIWGAEEGISPVDGPEPETTLYEYSLATGDEDWETLPDRLSAALPLVVAGERSTTQPMEPKMPTKDIVAEYLADYEFRFDCGGGHIPDDNERTLLEDFGNGLLAAIRADTGGE